MSFGDAVIDPALLRESSYQLASNTAGDGTGKLISLHATATEIRTCSQVMLGMQLRPGCLPQALPELSGGPTSWVVSAQAQRRLIMLLPTNLRRMGYSLHSESTLAPLQVHTISDTTFFSSNHSVTLLKDVCRNRGLKVGGNKRALIARLEEHDTISGVSSAGWVSSYSRFLCSRGRKAWPVKTRSALLALSSLKRVHASLKNISKAPYVVKTETMIRKTVVAATATKTMAVMKTKMLRAMMTEVASLLPVQWFQVRPPITSSYGAILYLTFPSIT